MGGRFQSLGRDPPEIEGSIPLVLPADPITMEVHNPFVVSSSNHAHRHPPFDRLRTNG